MSIQSDYTVGLSKETTYGAYVAPTRFLEADATLKEAVETAQGTEYAQCLTGNHEVDDGAVVRPLRALVRIATENDRRTMEYNRQREKDAFGICQRKIAERGLDMKLVRVECSFDGSKIVFESDRSGGQQIYVMNADGSNQQRISHGGGRYATPEWSPRGDLIAFTKMGGGEFRIGVMTPAGGGTRRGIGEHGRDGPRHVRDGPRHVGHGPRHVGHGP